MKKIQINLSEPTAELLQRIKAEYGLRSYGEVVEFLVRDYITKQSIETISRTISDRVKESVVKTLENKIEKDLNAIRIRTGYMNKVQSINLDLLNHLIMVQRLDNDVLYGVSNKAYTKLYRIAQENYQEMIEEKQTKKATKKMTLKKPTADS